eukprot:1180099-Prorocentrum_minimum.AAC.2
MDRAELAHLQCGHDVVTPDASDVANVLDGYVSSKLPQDVQQHARPITAEAHLRRNKTNK